MSDVIDSNIPNANTAPAVVNSEPANQGNVAAAVLTATPDPMDVAGVHQLFGAALEQRLREIGSIPPPTQTSTPTPAPAPRRVRPNLGIEPAQAPVAAPVTAPPNNALVLPDVAVWADPVNGADVLNGTAAAISRYVVLSEGAADAVALWIAHTHCFQSFQCTPRLNLSSPEKGCGKTTLRDVIAALVPRPLSTEHLTRAVLFRVIDEQHPTVLADECDAWLLENEELRGLLNAGHRRGGQVLRYDPSLRTVRGFSVFAPVVLCGIGELPVTLSDRSISLSLKRAMPGEICERFDSRRVNREAELGRRLARFCADNQARIEACDPALPSGAVNRLGDNWRPLFAIAEIAGGDWPRRVATAFAKLAVHDLDEQGTGTMLLADIQQVLRTRNVGRIFSQALVQALCAMAERPWLEAHKRRPINEIWLGSQLRAYGIKPATMRIGRALRKGYHAADFQDAFRRYVPLTGLASRNTVTVPANTGDYEI